MAVVDVKSTLLTNRDAAPRTINAAVNDGARVRSKAFTVEVTNGDSIGSTFRLCDIPSNARISSIRIFCDAITSAAADIGLYQTTANGSAVVDVDAYASAFSIASAITVGTEVMFEARNVDKVAKRVFEDAGLTADPFRDYDLVATLTAAAGASGTLSGVVEYVID
jgi:hypothetical protein